LSKGDTKTATEQGATDPSIQTTKQDGQSDTTLTSTKITIDNRTSSKDLPGVMVHETTHAGEARKDPAKFDKDREAEKGMPYDQRPQEQRAIQMSKTYSKEIAQQAKEIKTQREQQQKDDNQ
jgi:hypothetical protein